MTKKDLIAFEQMIADVYSTGKIRAPIHLSAGNEDQLIKIFKKIDRKDWVCSTWRSHYHALLHGVPEKRVREEIIKGHSITLCFPEYRFLTSAIVGGILPIATGIALAIKRKKEKRHVWCFVGDMAAESGAFYEATKYANNHNLPITFVVEDNGMSINTSTSDVWGAKHRRKSDYKIPLQKNVIRYFYTNHKWPHIGIGQWVDFD